MNKQETEYAGVVIDAKKTFFSAKDVITIIGLLLVIAGAWGAKTTTDDKQDARINTNASDIEKMNRKNDKTEAKMEALMNTLNAIDKNVVEIKTRMDEKEKNHK